MLHACRWSWLQYLSTVSVSNVTFIDLSSAVCKFKAHKRCAVRSTNNCKWTTLASIGNDIIEDEEGVSDEAVLCVSAHVTRYPTHSARENVSTKAN